MSTGENSSRSTGEAFPQDRASQVLEGSSTPQIVIPDHELLRRIGSGSYGEVWLARNLTGSYRAVKVISRSSFEDDKPFDREFAGISKFEPISCLHEGFLDVLHVGTDSTKTFLYYVMELADDAVSAQQINPATYTPRTLASEVARVGKLSVQETLRIGLSLTQTLTALHDYGLVHRDIKPSNIVFSHGIPKLADIGLVTDLANAARTWVGTAGFIPPEGPGSKQADIYSLGKVLYEVSTGKDRQDFPALPTNLDVSPEHEVLLELNEVLVRACHHDPEKRYASAWDMNAELAAVASGRSVRRLRLLERRWASFKRGLTVAGLFVVVLAVLCYAAYRDWNARVIVLQQEVGANLAYGNNAVEAGDFLGALPHYANVVRRDVGDLQESTHRLRFGSVLAQCPKVTRYWPGDKHINTGQFSPDGSCVIIAESEGAAKIFNLRTGELQGAPFSDNRVLASACYSPDGRLIVTTSERNTAEIWAADTQTHLQRMEHPDKVFSACFTPDGKQLITPCKDGIVRVWDPATGALLSTIQVGGQVTFVALNKNADMLVTCGRDGAARLFDFPSGRLRVPPLKHGIWVTYACFSPDETKLITTSDDPRVRIWDVATGKPLLPDMAHKDMVSNVAYSPDGSMIATASLDGSVRLWNAKNFQPVERNPVLQQGERVTFASFSPDGRCILVCCADGSVRLWDLSTAATTPMPQARRYCEEGTCFVESATNSFEIRDSSTGQRLCNPITVPDSALPELTRDGRFASCVSVARSATATNHMVRIWNTRTGKLLVEDLILPNGFDKVALSDDGEMVAAYGRRLAQVWAVRTRKPIAEPMKHEGVVTTAMFSRNGKVLLTCVGNSVYGWRAETGAALFPPLTHIAFVRHIDLSRDDALVASCCADDHLTKCYAQIWDLRTGKAVGPRLMHGDGVAHCSFSPDGKRLVTSGEESVAIVWDVNTGKPIGSPLRHNARVQSACFSRDGTLILTASHDKSARVWSTETTHPVTPPLPHLRRLSSAVFLPDGKGAVTTDGTRTWVWRLESETRPLGEVLQTARFLSGGGLTESTPMSGTNVVPLVYETPSPKQIADWHDSQALRFEVEGEWQSAAFHLKILQRLSADDPAVCARLEIAQRNIH